MTNSHLKNLIKLDQDQSLIDLLGWNTFFKPDETEEFIEAISSYAFPYSRKSQPIPFGIYLNPDNFPIGYVVLKGLNMDVLTAEIGIAILDEKYRNKGYGTLALKRLIIYAFQELHIQTIGAAILLSNKASINMFKNLGFVVTEIMYKSWPMPNGDLADMVFMELTK
ncbi:MULTISPECIES: GNAT family N-acetyltransferase [unclassified Okeania]|uniref:GNAT family N-acetyltransferase n=1 Tax=unclassified Okeania TaxID=2634635 RepID=UPI0013B652E3|nr:MULTISPECIES: GNAT family N-acetyltransferase [unclassified Okeania]NES79809.1 GNAT family N-acetyltransferase [Okeania sp. SIO1H4]NET23498.1 GNAT family N-acetyltransferase [Okeania sp. SIO1H5]NET97308.1 GNAT family N-acetyltransferase [Okeania sp. SIO1H2]